jgi:hypothetical protein
MDIGVGIRNMGAQSTRALMAGCARAVEKMLKPYRSSVLAYPVNAHEHYM